MPITVTSTCGGSSTRRCRVAKRPDKFEPIEKTIEVEVNGKTYELDLGRVSRLMMIDPAHLDDELQEQAAFYYWIATLATEAQFIAEDAQHVFDVFYAELVSEKREELTPKDGKAPAGTIIDAEAKSDPEYNKRHKQIVKARQTAAMLATVRDAVKMRQFTLIERSKRLSKDDAAESEG